MDHIKLGLGLFEAFTIIASRTDSSVQPSIADALVWLRTRLLAAGMNTEVAIPDCKAAIYDAAQESVAVQHGRVRVSDSGNRVRPELRLRR